METDEEPSSPEKQGELTSHFISPGSFKMISFIPNVTNLELQLLNQPLPLPPPPPLTNSKELINSHRRNKSLIRRQRLNERSALYMKYYSLSNERQLRFAASTCNVEVLWNMLNRGTNPNCYDEHKRSPLHLAACRGYGDIITILLQNGANPNIVDSLGNTPLHLAVISASSKKFNNVVRILLHHGASVHAKDRTGKFFYFSNITKIKYFLSITIF